MRSLPRCNSAPAFCVDTSSPQTKNVWLVTGTPFSTTLRQLERPLFVLGHAVNGMHLQDIYEGWPPKTNDEVVDALKKLMIRAPLPICSPAHALPLTSCALAMRRSHEVATHRRAGRARTARDRPGHGVVAPLVKSSGSASWPRLSMEARG